MARLTEEMVLARTKTSDLSSIRTLNFWGRELLDVSLIRGMHNVEVLSLSVNKIASLSDFQYCRNLQELYMRRNNIRELNQILYLQDLPRLKILWLEENPCAQADQYRLTVLRALPNLQKLDNITVHPEEVQDALRKGRELVHPNDVQDMSPMGENEWGSGTSSLSHSPTQHERSPPRLQGSGDREPETVDVRRHSAYVQDDEHHTYYKADRRNANYGADPVIYTRQHTSPSERSPVSTNSHPEEVLPLESIKDEISCCMTKSDSLPLMKEEDSRLQVSTSDRGLQNSKPPCPRRPSTRSSNILSAVLYLIKELDYPNLEAVQVAIRSRMDELDV
ncbi:cilia- and flagella-associated protein 410 isoform X2 [Cryptotermes secundus]|uniref:cilia- and flagella-associated protein 410 isoform X2 n=1 Tax=Cryptotermes secundus TaxID=105785 RepID=UPI000CD7D888|nr:cilia- and flagella-associated protein 410 isoform X2 [Cryptotermes secundus]